MNTTTPTTAGQVLDELDAAAQRRRELVDARAGGARPMGSAEMRERAALFAREVQLWDAVQVGVVHLLQDDVDPVVLRRLLMRAAAAASMRASERAEHWQVDAEHAERAAAGA